MLHRICRLQLRFAVEFALLNGKSRKYGIQASEATGDPTAFNTYEEFEEAVKEQIRYELRGTVASSHVCDDIGFQRVVPALSLSFYECVENAKDYAWGGAKYNLGNGIDAIGVADLINSLIAVKKLVFDEKKVTMQRLLDALDANFVGYEDVKKMCDEAPKYGNDDDEVNELTGDMFCFIADYIESFHSKFGKMTPGILPVSGNTPFGLEVGALPSGRLAWKPLADGVSPNQGTDTEGMGAVLKSISHIPHGRFNQGTLLNVKMDTVFRDSPNSDKRTDELPAESLLPGRIPHTVQCHRYGDLKRSTEASGGLQRTAGTCSWLYSIFYRAWKRSTGRYHFQNFTFQYLLGKRVKFAVFHKKMRQISYRGCASCAVAGSRQGVLDRRNSVWN